MSLEVFLDDTPGETRGVIARDGHIEWLIIQRDDDPPQTRLGARSVGRVTQSEPGFNAAFVDLGAPGRPAFLPFGQGRAPREGEHLEVEVTAEPREQKGPTVRLIGPADGPPRLVMPGPDVRAELARLAPGVPVETGSAAIQASWDAEEKAMGQGDFFAEVALDLAVQRTRALVAVDIDYAHLPGRDAKRGRLRANLEGLRHAARLIRLKSWGGLVAIDLVGTRLDADAIAAAARTAFDEPEAVFGPLNRFGVLQLALPWRRTPIEERLRGWAGSQVLTTAAINTVRSLRMRVLQDKATPRFTARCHPEEAAIAGPLAARLGPRVAVVADPAVALGRADIQEA
ncbi:RNA-binding protein [Brevundimonas sp. AAP58]|uniref:ribonuclease E/G n=1 Tax=Brevundimonas sp. AAP58 TaxID=1523422 RepID=UPI0006B9932C|nr:ribonuclease E/G [Brevundimonas sp. AAP58]KPF74370.1 RNA-binding protein [Brevundimonas sp. AAP58]